MASSFSLFECCMTTQNLSMGKSPLISTSRVIEMSFYQKTCWFPRRGILGGVLKAHVAEKDATFARTKSHVYRVRWMFKGSSVSNNP